MDVLLQNKVQMKYRIPKYLETCENLRDLSDLMRFGKYVQLSSLTIYQFIAQNAISVCAVFLFFETAVNVITGNSQ